MSYQFNLRGGKTAKLKEDQVREIRMLLKQGVTGSAIAKKFNIHPSTVYGINAGRYYFGVGKLAYEEH